MVGDEGGDRNLQFIDAAVNASPDLAFCQQGKPG